MLDENEMKYKIAVRTIQGIILTFSTDEYKIEDEFVTWLDIRTNSIKKFHSTNCEISEVLDG